MAFLKCLPQELYNWDFVHSELDRQGKEKPHLCTALFYIDQRNEGEEFIITGAMRKKTKRALQNNPCNKPIWCCIRDWLMLYWPEVWEQRWRRPRPFSKSASSSAPPRSAGGKPKTKKLSKWNTPILQERSTWTTIQIFLRNPQLFAVLPVQHIRWSPSSAHFQWGCQWTGGFLRPQHSEQFQEFPLNVFVFLNELAYLSSHWCICICQRIYIWQWRKSVVSCVFVLFKLVGPPFTTFTTVLGVSNDCISLSTEQTKNLL